MTIFSTLPQFMVRDCPNEPVTFPALVVPSAFPYPYRCLSILPTQASLLAQQVLVWLVQWDPRLVLYQPAAFHVHLPRRVMQRPESFQYNLLVCKPACCFLQESSDVSRPVVLCACQGPIAHQWNIVLSGPGWTGVRSQLLCRTFR